MINWAYLPFSDKPPQFILDVVKVFEDNEQNISSTTHNKQESNEVLAKLADALEDIGFTVERGKKKEQKINVPVLYGQNGSIKKFFNADAFFKKEGFVLEVEAGRAVSNYQFLKDLFQACMMQDVFYLGIAVRNDYRNKPDFEKMLTFFDTLYKSGRLELPLKGILLIGY